MGIEDDLANLLSFASFEGASPPTELINAMLKSVELSMLKRIKAMIDGKIKQISAEELAMAKKDINPFVILGVSQDASMEEVNRAYRDKAAKAHPDVGGSHAEMVRINAARDAIRIFRGLSK